VAVAQTERGLVVTMPHVPGRAWPLIGMGMFLVLGSVAIGAFALPWIATSASISTTTYVVISAYVLVVGALAWVTLDHGLAQLRDIEVVVDPRAQALIVPRYGTVSALPDGALTIPLSDVVRVRAFETGLKGVMRGKVCVDRATDEACFFPSHEVAPFAVLETFAMEIAEAVDRARAASSTAGVG
jgi:hypothetical protein